MSKPTRTKRPSNIIFPWYFHAKVHKEKLLCFAYTAIENTAAIPPKMNTIINKNILGTIFFINTK